MKCGIILAGGNGSRLYPITYAVSKQLLPVYNKPMLMYSISTLVSAGVEHITFIVKPDMQMVFAQLIAEINPEAKLFQYDFVVQNKPRGLAEAFILAKISTEDDTCLILGDNIFYGGDNFTNTINQAWGTNTIFGYKVKNPSAYGVATLSEYGYIIGVEEKPKNPKSNWAIPGLYFFDHTVISKAKKCKPSARGELEIVDIISQYIDEKTINFVKFDDNVAWFDGGTFDDLLDASNFVKAIETRTNSKVGAL